MFAALRGSFAVIVMFRVLFMVARDVLALFWIYSSPNGPVVVLRHYSIMIKLETFPFNVGTRSIVLTDAQAVVSFTIQTVHP